MVKRWRVAVGLAMLMWLGGCSVQMAYNNLDRLARWSIDDYVDLNRAQRERFDQRFPVLWDWHRREHLPRYAQLLDDAALRLGEEIDEAYLQAVVERVMTWADEVERRGLPLAAELLASLSDAQVDRLAVALAESNRELAAPEQGIPMAEAQTRWREEFADRFTDFSGRLEAVQRAFLDQQARHYRPELVLWSDYRRRWQRAFLALLAGRHDTAALEQGLRELTGDRARYFGPELTAVYEHNNRLARKISVWLVNSLNDRQRDRFRERLGDLADDLRQLAAQEPRST